MTWKDITLLQYEDIRQTLADDSMTQESKLARIVSIVLDTELYDIPLNKMAGALEEVNKLVALPPKQAKTKKKYEINGKIYRLTDMNNLTMAQFMDFQELSKQPDSNVNKIVAIFLIPEDKETYNKGYDLDEVYNDIWSMNVEDALGIVGFIVGVSMKKYKTSLIYLLLQTLTDKTIKWETRKKLAKNLWTGLRNMDYSLSL